MKREDFIGIIPARWASSRFPGKPLALLGGRPVIEHVWRRVSAVLEHVVVATDDERISAAVEAFGGEAVLTSTNHLNGTSRCLEAYEKAGRGEKVVINIQGDEPFIDPGQVEAVMGCFDDASTDIATLVRPFPQEGNYEDLANPNRPKVVVGAGGRALYFSRQVVPYVRGKEPSLWPSLHQYYTHIGLYAYRADVLRRIVTFAPSPLELAESLEQLRWLENGLTISTAVTTVETIGIDTPEDLLQAQKFIV